MCAALPAAAEQTVTPEMTTPIKLSNTDINRVVCTNGEMADAIFSKEKGLKVSIQGKNAFVKYLIQVTAGAEQLVRKPTELFFVCDSQVYSLVASPEPGPSQTVYLSSGARNRAEKNMAMMGAMPTEEKALFLIQAAYKDELSDSLNVTRKQERVKASPEKGSPEEEKQLWEEVDITLSRTVRAEGVGLVLKEYVVTARKNVELREINFLRKEFGEEFAAVMVDPLKLKEKEKGRLFIVERVGRQ